MLEYVRLFAPLHSNSGYGKSGRAILAALLASGIKVQAVEIETVSKTSYRVDGNEDITYNPMYAHLPRPAIQEAELRAALAESIPHDAVNLIMCSPDAMAHIGQEYPGVRIGLTMLEADKLTPYWSRACHNVQGIITPSKWNAQTFRKSLPSFYPVFTVPLCIDERLWQAFGAVPRIEDRPEFLFTSVFSTCERKNWRGLIQAFSEEFPGESVGLILRPNRVAEVREMAEWAGVRGVWIEVLDKPLTDSEMAQLYRASDAYILPSAEGFGVPFVEAMLCGCPILALDKGGAADIVNEENGQVIRSKMVPCVGHLPQIYRSDSKWPYASVPEIRKAMRALYARQTDEETRINLARMVSRTAITYGREAIGARLVHALNVIQMSAAVNKKAAFKDVKRKEDRNPPIAIITTYNEKHHTDLLVRSLRAHSPGVRIILTDDGSTDGTQDWAASAGIEVIENAHTGSLAANRNAVLRLLRAEYESEPISRKPFVMTFDNDVEVTPCWELPLIAVLENRRDIGIIAPLKELRTGQVQNTGGRIKPDGGTYGLYLEQPLSFPDYAESACMLIRPEIWTSIDFTEEFKIWYDDVDYSMQARAAGYKIAATNSARVIHDAHTTSQHLRGSIDEMRLQFLRKWKESL